MLSIYLSDHQAQLIKISNAQRCPFTSVGYVKTQQKKLLESCWLTAKKKHVAQQFVQPDLAQLASLLSANISPDVISQACIEIMANLPQNINLIFINNLLKEPRLLSVVKLVICKVLLQQHSSNLIALIDLQTLYFAFSTSKNLTDKTLVKVEFTAFVDGKSDIEDLVFGFNYLCQSELVNSPLMSLFYYRYLGSKLMRLATMRAVIWLQKVYCKYCYKVALLNYCHLLMHHLIK